MTGVVIFLVCFAIAALIAVKASAHINKDNNPASAPAAIWGHWQVSYMDNEGTLTKRTIRILEVRPNLRKIEVWCELRNAERTMYLDSILEATEVSTSLPINMDDWLRSYRKARRQEQ